MLDVPVRRASQFPVELFLLEPNKGAITQDRISSPGYHNGTFHLVAGAALDLAYSVMLPYAFYDDVIVNRTLNLRNLRYQLTQRLCRRILQFSQLPRRGEYGL